MENKGFCYRVVNDNKTVYLYNGYYGKGIVKYIGIDESEKEVIDVLSKEFGTLSTVDPKFKFRYAESKQRVLSKRHNGLMEDFELAEKVSNKKSTEEEFNKSFEKIIAEVEESYKELIEFGKYSITTSTIGEFDEYLRYGKIYDDHSVVVYGTISELKERSIEVFNVDRIDNEFYVTNDNIKYEKTILDIKARALLIGGY